jgi:hypothetical protein
MNTAKKEDKPMFLVCGSVSMPNAEKDVCSQCGAMVWPTRGSLIYARERKIPCVCLDCYAQLDEITFAGFIHQGSMLRKDLGDKLFVKFELARIKERTKGI